MLRQIGIVALLNFRNLPQRRWQSMVIVAGMACVIGVLLSMLSMTEGMRRAYLTYGDPRNAIVVARGTAWENVSAIARDQAGIIMNAPGIARAQDGSPLADPALVVTVPALLRKTGGKTIIILRSFGDKGAALRPTFRLLTGRMFRSGTHELVAGTGAQFQFEHMAVGDKVTLPDGEWPIVGTFTTGDLLDGQLVGDTQTLMPALRHKTYNTVLVRLASVGTLTTLRNALSRNPTLSVDVMRLPDWNAKISGDTTSFFRVLVYGVGVILAIGALFGCFNTMYSAVGTRSREIATLRALGYSGFAMAASVILEAMLLSATGALVGAFIAWALYDGVQSGFGPDVFTLVVSPGMVGIALLWAIMVAFLGGVLPSIQAARGAVAISLRAR
jgi:putative ABC transport system permease protein